MRLIGHLSDEKGARAFADFLYVNGIASQLEHERQDGWGIWITDEDEIGNATSLLEDYRRNPADAKFVEQAKTAEDLREQEKKEYEDYRKRVKSRRHLFSPLTAYGVGPLSFAMIIACLVIFTWSKFGHSFEPVHFLFISEHGAGVVDKTLPEVRSGEIWRVITPIFIHMTALHIIFNMLWLRDLGSMVEARQSSGFLFVFVVVVAAISNLAQFFYHGPAFGGMSGVDYGLLGYIWIRGKIEPGSGLVLHRYVVITSLVWFFACLVNIIPGVANAAHGAGLGAGMLWGYLAAKRGGR
jgi:GlpG protein